MKSFFHSRGYCATIGFLLGTLFGAGVMDLTRDNKTVAVVAEAVPSGGADGSGAPPIGRGENALDTAGAEDLPECGSDPAKNKYPCRGMNAGQVEIRYGFRIEPLPTQCAPEIDKRAYPCFVQEQGADGKTIIKTFGWATK